MSLEKSTTIDLVEVNESSCVQVRTRTDIKENGIIVSSNLHRHVICPGDDFSGESDKVRSICSALHTTDVVASYKLLTSEAQGV